MHLPWARNCLQTIVVGLVSLTLAIVTLIVAFKWEVERHFIQNGPWRTQSTLGSAEATPYVRASLAAGGLMALTKSEAVYFAASRVNGESLSSHCTYLISGKPPAAQYWSLTVYGSDRMLIPNDEGRYSVSGRDVELSQSGEVKFTIARRRTGDEPWLPSSPTVDFDSGDAWHRKILLLEGGPDQLHFILRLYKPAASVSTDLHTTELFRIEKVRC